MSLNSDYLVGKKRRKTSQRLILKSAKDTTAEHQEWAPATPQLKCLITTDQRVSAPSKAIQA